MVEEVEMDKPREGVARQKKIRRTIYAVVGLLGIAGVTFALSRLEPAAPSVKRATVWMDIVKRGSMLRQVRGPGTLAESSKSSFYLGPSSSRIPSSSK